MNASERDPGKRLIKSYGLKLADDNDITAEILKMMNGRGEGMAMGREVDGRDAPAWSNTPDTLVFEVPPGRLVDRAGFELHTGTSGCASPVSSSIRHGAAKRSCECFGGAKDMDRAKERARNTKLRHEWRLAMSKSGTSRSLSASRIGCRRFDDRAPGLRGGLCPSDSAPS